MCLSTFSPNLSRVRHWSCPDRLPSSFLDGEDLCLPQYREAEDCLGVTHGQPKSRVLAAWEEKVLSLRELRKKRNNRPTVKKVVEDQVELSFDVESENWKMTVEQSAPEPQLKTFEFYPNRPEEDVTVDEPFCQPLSYLDADPPGLVDHLHPYFPNVSMMLERRKSTNSTSICLLANNRHENANSLVIQNRLTPDLLNFNQCSRNNFSSDENANCVVLAPPTETSVSCTGETNPSSEPIASTCCGGIKEAFSDKKNECLNSFEPVPADRISTWNTNIEFVDRLLLSSYQLLTWLLLLFRPLHHSSSPVSAQRSQKFDARPGHTLGLSTYSSIVFWRRRPHVISKLAKYSWLFGFALFLVSPVKSVTVTDHNQDDEILCSSDGIYRGNIDINMKDETTHMSSLKRYENCSVVEGSISINMAIYQGSENDTVMNYSMPNLTEVTDFLLLFRADKITSLETIFPKLAVIRGHKLVHNYALAIYQMKNIETVGLPSLTHIMNGGVRIEKNPNLCYVNTIDWTKIVVKEEDRKNHIEISGNQEPNK